MKFFVDTITGMTLAQGEKAVLNFGGPWGEWQKSGRAVWLDVPEGEDPSDIDVVLSPAPALVVNETRKAARLAAKSTKEERRNRLKAADLTVVPPAFRCLLQDLVDEVKDMGGFR